VKETIDSSGVPIRVWEPTGHPLEPLVMQQARPVAGLPITEAVCLMPDAHFGIGGPVGGVIATRGGGNHFIEVCLDETRAVWLMVHSGSRGVGNRIGTYFAQRARDQAHVLKRRLPDGALASSAARTRGCSTRRPAPTRTSTR
jgi:RNA-splicing ligase RtcB